MNTCAFVEDAKRESIAAIVDAAHLKDDGALPTRGLFVTGCMAQRYAQELTLTLTLALTLARTLTLTLTLTLAEQADELGGTPRTLDAGQA